MKPRLRDYLTIFFALMVIFLCGTGVGYLLGEKKGRAHDSTKVPPKPTKSRAWEERTMVRLTESLDLSEAQQRTIREDVEEAAQEALAKGKKAMKSAANKVRNRINASKYESFQ